MCIIHFFYNKISYFNIYNKYGKRLIFLGIDHSILILVLKWIFKFIEVIYHIKILIKIKKVVLR